MAKILVVDDSRTSRKFLKNILQEMNHEIIGEAKNGLEAIEKYKELHPDLTTMDITMPELDGIGALKEIMEFDSSAKVIMVTAAGQKSKVVEAVKLGAADYVTKPFDPDKIKASIEKSL